MKLNSLTLRATSPARALSALLAMASLALVLPGPASAQEEGADPRALGSEAPTVTLDEAIRRAVEHHPAAVAAEAAVATADANLLQARGSLLPSLSLASAYSNSSNERFDQTTGRLISESYTAQLQGSYEIFAGGRRLADLRVAGADVRAAEAQRRAERFRTALETTEIFYAAAAASDLLAAAVQRLERARQQLDFAETRLEVGTATSSDVLRAQLEVGNAELSVLDAESSMRENELALGRQIGVAGGARPAPASLPSSAPALPDSEAMIEWALGTAPSVVAAEAALRSRSAARLASYTGYLPSLRVTGGYDWFGFDFPPGQESWSLRLIASLPVFNGFQREAGVRRAAAAERAAEARALDAAIAVRVEVEAAVQQIRTAERRVEISGRAVELAREDLRVQEERYRIGAATILDLQASQVALAEADVAAVRARQQLGGSVARLETVLGERIESIGATR